MTAAAAKARPANARAFVTPAGRLRVGAFAADATVSCPVIALATAVILLPFRFPQLHVQHRDASPPAESVCLFYELAPGLLVYGFTFSFVHRLWIMFAQVRA